MWRSSFSSVYSTAESLDKLIKEELADQIAHFVQYFVSKSYWVATFGEYVKFLSFFQ